jgi:hypothetical protein
MFLEKLVFWALFLTVAGDSTSKGRHIQGEDFNLAALACALNIDVKKRTVMTLAAPGWFLRRIAREPE